VVRSARLGGVTEIRERVAVITGARQGIGRRIAELFAQRGYSLALIDLEYPKETLSGLPAHCVAEGIVADVADENQVAIAHQLVLDRFGRPDVLVNNAGVSAIAPAEATSADQWRRVIEVNLTGPFLLCTAFGRSMLEPGPPAAIVNIASIAGLAGIPDRVAYNASKHGLVGLTRTLAVEWGARGIRVNAVCPAFVKTEMDEADSASGAYTEQDILDRNPLDRFAVPGDVAELVEFLADPQRSGFVNGAAIPVDGGWLADAGWRALRLRKRPAPTPNSLTEAQPHGSKKG
jgi:NAD(P)-dependent dehydrogenase (short-subunit alcohol dehydrogenase family)